MESAQCSSAPGCGIYFWSASATRANASNLSVPYGRWLLLRGALLGGREVGGNSHSRPSSS